MVPMTGGSSTAVKILGTALAGAMGDTTDQIISNGKVDVVRTIKSGLMSAATAAAGAVISKAVSSTAGRTLYNSKGDASPREAQKRSAKPEIRFTQKTASSKFSQGGTMNNKTIGQVSKMLRSGSMSPSELPVNYISRGGKMLVENTRSALALMRANVPVSQWNLIDVSADVGMVEHITDRLVRNGLEELGTQFIRITGSGSGASYLG